jgi:hypothetical protein
MGAEPAWGLLSLSLPRADEAWLDGFAARHRRAGQGVGPGHRRRRHGARAARRHLRADRLRPAGSGAAAPGRARRRHLGDRPARRRALPDWLRGGAAEPRRLSFLRPRPRLAEGRALRGIAERRDRRLRRAAPGPRAPARGERRRCAVLELEHMPLAPGRRGRGRGRRPRDGARRRRRLPAVFHGPGGARVRAARGRRGLAGAPPVRIGAIRAEPGLELRAAGGRSAAGGRLGPFRGGDAMTALSPRLLRDPVHFFALGFGSGLAPWAPGTAGTLVGVLLDPLLRPLGLELRVLVVALMFGAGRLAVRRKRAQAGSSRSSGHRLGRDRRLPGVDAGGPRGLGLGAGRIRRVPVLRHRQAVADSPTGSRCGRRARHYVGRCHGGGLGRGGAPRVQYALGIQ